MKTTVRRRTAPRVWQTEDEANVLAHQISGHRDTIAVVPSMPQERIQECIVEETMDVFVSQVMKEGVKLIPQDKVQNCTVGKSLQCQFQGFARKLGRVIQPIHQKRISDRVTEQIVDVAVPQIRNKSSK